MLIYVIEATRIREIIVKKSRMFVLAKRNYEV